MGYSSRIKNILNAKNLSQRAFAEMIDSPPSPNTKRCQKNRSQ